MPNHVYQRLVITASKEVLEEIKKAAQYTYDAEGDRPSRTVPFSEDAFFPMPKELRGTISGSGAIVYQEEYDAFMQDTEKIERNRALGLGCPITFEMAAELKAKYGHTNWYDWALENYGTKWGVYDVAEEWDECESSDGIESSISIEFQSAWGDAEKIIAKLSRQFPSASFVLEAIDDGGWFAHRKAIKDGGVTGIESFEFDNESDDFRALAASVGYPIYDEDEDE